MGYETFWRLEDWEIAERKVYGTMNKNTTLQHRVTQVDKPIDA